jgi:hypothetical protein
VTSFWWGRSVAGCWRRKNAANRRLVAAAFEAGVGWVGSCWLGLANWCAERVRGGSDEPDAAVGCGEAGGGESLGVGCGCGCADADRGGAGWRDASGGGLRIPSFCCCATFACWLRWPNRSCCSRLDLNSV